MSKLQLFLIYAIHFETFFSKSFVLLQFYDNSLVTLIRRNVTYMYLKAYKLCDL